jgi:acyl-homoserine lactone acylase PvdQ
LKPTRCCWFLVWTALAVSLASAAKVEIIRDRYGVPHIYGKTAADVVFGLMYAQAEDNFWQIEEDYVRALGRQAELRGPEGLMNDLGVRLFETLRQAQEEYARLDAKTRALCDAFAAGLNHFLATHPQVQTRLIRRFEPWHILAFQNLQTISPQAMGVTMAEIQAAFPDLNLRPPAARPPSGEDWDADEGSNMWALAPSRSASGRAMLFINPHVGFFGGGQRYEAYLHSKDGLHVSGFAILGTPYIRSGFTAGHGWSHTNNYADTLDVWRETFDDPANPLAYRYGNGYRQATEWTDEIRIGAAGETVNVRLRKTHHGPIVAIKEGHPLAVRSARYGRAGQFEQRWAMAKARSLAEFQAALARRSLVGSNTIYADRRGNIFYLHGNTVPKRSLKFDWARPVDGTDPESDWQGVHEIHDLPQLTNPKAGYLQNCNSTPFLMTADSGLDAAKYPPYMAPEQDNLRAQMSRRLLESKPRFTFADWERMATDTTVLKAEMSLPALFQAWEAEKPASLVELIAELRSWNRRSSVDSIAMTLFMRWDRDGAGGLAALERVKSRLEADFGTWRVPWGEINRLQRIHTSGTQEPFSDTRPSLPTAGAPGTPAGIIFNVTARTAPGQKRMYGASGNTYVAVIELGRKLRAKSALVFGQSADPQSPHYFDQAELYAQGRFKPVWFYKGEVKKNTEQKYRVRN